MCKTPHYNIIMIYNQKDSPLLVEFVIDTLRMQEIEITASIQKFTKEYILRLPKSPFNNQNISLVAYIILRYFWSHIFRT